MFRDKYLSGQLATMTTSSDSIGLMTNQTAIWIDSCYIPDRPVYTTGLAVHLAIPLDPARFAAAVARAVSEADALCVRFVMRDGAPCQIRHPPPADPLPCIDLSTAMDPDAAARAFIDDALSHVFHLDAAPPFRFFLLRLGTSSYIWLQTYHHIAIDAPGRNHLTRRALAHYRTDAAACAPQDAAPYAEAIAQERLAKAPPLP